MQTVVSKDGTKIAYDQAGSGPTLILVGGMFEQRAFDSETAKLALQPLLAEHFTVIHYDRRGRGDSADTLPFAVEREIEDIETLIDKVGGPAYVFGISSGAALAFEAVLRLGSKVKKLALYEPPYNDELDARAAWVGFRKDLDTAIGEGRNADAVGSFMSLLGMPPDQLAGMREYPMWGMWEAIAPTMAYDAAAVGPEAAVPVDRARDVNVPTLVMDGSESFPFMHASAEALSQAIPGGQHRRLEGQTHEVNTDVLAPTLLEFFQS
jgi:pimeloyl-ACP methyl ester carboxylesterase